ncbi:helix-turn-helix domain-containing protein [Bradyrhizobium sp. ORS 86]|uniref:helix-turn-helix domain-containing protein n=1 Tax=Bradyrhizobium sp. ORS 86 TaxID=1685970 RepID=UPI00388E0EF3
MTPLAALRRFRLECARKELSDPHLGVAVAGAVQRWQLGNPGRFAADYRKAFGESPSETLRFGREDKC